MDCQNIRKITDKKKHKKMHISQTKAHNRNNNKNSKETEWNFAFILPVQLQFYTNMLHMLIPFSISAASIHIFSILARLDFPDKAGRWLLGVIGFNKWWNVPICKIPIWKRETS